MFHPLILFSSLLRFLLVHFSFLFLTLLFSSSLLFSSLLFSSLIFSSLLTSFLFFSLSLFVHLYSFRSITSLFFSPLPFCPSFLLSPSPHPYHLFFLPFLSPYVSPIQIIDVVFIHLCSSLLTYR